MKVKIDGLLEIEDLDRLGYIIFGARKNVTRRGAFWESKGSFHFGNWEKGWSLLKRDKRGAFLAKVKEGKCVHARGMLD